METLKGYSNYGVSAHEKQIIFTAGRPHTQAKVSEEIEISLPDGWTTSESKMGGLMICGPAGDYLADDILSSWGDNPVLRWYDGKSDHRITLQWETL